MKCIKMEADWPSKNKDNKMPILDMKVWMDTKDCIVYQHYEKEVSRKTVLHSDSAHSEACKRSVHTQEILRRLLNSSQNLDWKTEVAPVCTEYMRRMMEAGYSEGYRKSILKHALTIYDKKWEENNEGVRPIYRPKDWKREEMRGEKKKKKYNWATKGGHLAPIFVPTTPGGKLLKMMRKVAEEEAGEGVKFKIVEIGGKTIKRQLQRSNPTGTPGCSADDCLACSKDRGSGGNCRRANVNYSIECQLCPENKRPVYIGETSRNLYTRGREHNNNRGDIESSFVRKHMEEAHKEREGDFRAKVTHTNKDSLSRQIREGVLIRREKRGLMNTKSEWFQPPLVRIQSNIVKGWD